MEEDHHFYFYHLRHQFNFHISRNFRGKHEGRRWSRCPERHMESGDSGYPYAAFLQKELTRIRLKIGKNEILTLELCGSCAICLRLDDRPGWLCPRLAHRSNRHLAQGDRYLSSIVIWIGGDGTGRKGKSS